MLVRIFLHYFFMQMENFRSTNFIFFTYCRVDDTQKSLGSMPVETTVKHQFSDAEDSDGVDEDEQMMKKMMNVMVILHQNIVQKNKSLSPMQSTSHVCLAVSLNTLTQAAIHRRNSLEFLLRVLMMIWPLSSQAVPLSLAHLSCFRLAGIHLARGTCLREEISHHNVTCVQAVIHLL